MKPLTYRSSSIHIRADSTRQRVRSTQSHSQPLPSPLRVASSRYAEADRPKRPKKNLTETKTEAREKSHTPVRYRLATSVKAKEETSGQWGVVASGVREKDMLQEQQASLAKLHQLRDSLTTEQLTAPIRYRHPKQKSKEPVRVKPRLVEGYLEFISGRAGEFTVGFDYSYLRQLGRAEASAAVDFGGWPILESLELCALDILEGSEPGGSRLLREYALLFLRRFEKNMTEVVLAAHYFRLAHRSLFLFLLSTRAFFIILLELAAAEALGDFVQPLREMLLGMLEGQRLLYNGRADIDRINNYVSETFRVLKITSEIEKRAVSLATAVKDLTTALRQQPHFHRLHLIMAELAQVQEADMRGMEFELLAQTEVVIGWAYYGLPPIPFLPPAPSHYTLVLSLEGVLLHYDSHRSTVLCRPYLEQFLTRVAAQYELIVFSNQPKPAADPLIAVIEKHRQHFDFRLYKDHLSLTGTGMAKDLSKLGRETEKVAMVDCVMEGPGVWTVPLWAGASEDRVLLMLEKELLGARGDLSQRGGRVGTLEHIEEREDENTISTSQ